MKNFSEALLGLEIGEKGFECLKKELQKKYDFDLAVDLLSLPCLRFEPKYRLSVLMALLEDEVVNDTVVGMLCDLLGDISGELWAFCRERLSAFVEEKYFRLSRSQLLMLAHTVEVMYAKGYGDTFDMCKSVYEKIQLRDSEFNPDSDDNVRIRLAKLAYSTNRYNFNEKFLAIESVERHMKASKRKYLLGVVKYYKALCLDSVGFSDEYGDADYYMMSSRMKGFALARIFLEYGRKNPETSREN